MDVEDPTAQFLIGFGVGSVFLAAGSAMLWPAFRRVGRLAATQREWEEAEAEVVDYEVITGGEYPETYAIVTFEASRDRRVRGRVHVKKGDVGIHFPVRYNPNNARDFYRSDKASPGWSDFAWGGMFFTGGVLLWIMPFVT